MWCQCYEKRIGNSLAREASRKNRASAMDKDRLVSHSLSCQHVSELINRMITTNGAVQGPLHHSSNTSLV